MRETECFDVTILGGGPAGLYSAFYSGLREMKTKMIEYQPQLGGKVHIYPEKMIWDVGGLAPLPGAKLIEQLVKQGLTFKPEVVLNEKIVSISKNEEGLFVLKAESGREHLSKAVIVAIGSGIIKHQKLKIEGAERFEVSNLHYTVKSLKYFKDKIVLISGGGNSAIDWANELEPIAKKVYVTHRKACLTGHESQISQLQCSSAECLARTSINKLIAGSGDRIERVQLKNFLTGEIKEVEVDEVIVNHGFDIDAALLNESELDIKLAEEFYIDGTSMSESSVPGLFAAGDILKHDGKLNLIAGAFQDAANAVNKAKQYIDPQADSIAMVSSHNEVFYTKNKKLVQAIVR
ncbi:NAD(P)/FAD-dependent oxidoreductase [Bacillus sp. FJAT-49736]|uniref:NAD(P)/FAD-dependent oxidoreductase n=1 Tax=Bacillus sp. FJAT-49736 TaxID=2833582 RepID=UPI001BC9D62F|nr:NAD(P)/FAD-dependent oxidoreductase [Bacillus sp. FJAT-49736]MBS4174122.1 NAD(P)/FAD-dependent oxidoreductase [Bacillus sp. FJAT-49736]